MRVQSQKQHVLARFFAGFWSAITSALTLSVAPKRDKATFCELNGHLLKAKLDPHCRYCGIEIQNIDMLRSIK
jgi:hypothetical protein